MISTLDDLAPARRWCAWRNELRGTKLSKVPYAGEKQRAKANDPRTWHTRAAAAACAERVVNGLGGGVGVILGALGDGFALIGIDLDTCRDPASGSLEEWAIEIIARFDSYSEISPSDTGAKIFALITTEALDEVRAATGFEDGRKFARAKGGDHPPAIELYSGSRYFAVTGRRLDNSPVELAILPPATLVWLLTVAGPAFVGATKQNSKSSGADQSRSATVFRIARRMRREGATYDAFREAVRTDPRTADWFTEKGIAAGERELHRAFDKEGGPDLTGAIVVRAGLRHEAADAGLAALAAAQVPFFQRDRSLVRVEMLSAKTASGDITSAPGIVEVTPASLSRELGRAATWAKCDVNGQLSRIDPPQAVIEQIADMVGSWPFSMLSGVIGTPTLRSDGSLLVAEGYDEPTGLVLLGRPSMPTIPAEPTRSDALDAVELLSTLLDEFPFRDGGGKESIDRAVALSKLLTPVLRGAMPAAPMHLANAPQPGSGKSYLADLASEIATGERCAVVAFSPNPEETEKRLAGSALAGHPIVALDNASGIVSGDLLCQLTERPLLQLRPLGTSKMVRVANTFSVLANGNNASIADDMVRRTIQCRLDANMEAPEQRVFRNNPLARIRLNRGAYIAACLIIARAYICAGQPGLLPPLASYEAWSAIVRSPLVWLGRGDPVASMASLRSSDPQRLLRVAVFKAWAEELGTGGAYITADLIGRASDPGPIGGFLRPQLRAALIEIARDRAGGLDSRRLGRWLSKAESNVADGLKLTCDRGDVGRPRWVLSHA